MKKLSGDQKIKKELHELMKLQGNNSRTEQELKELIDNTDRAIQHKGQELINYEWEVWGRTDWINRITKMFPDVMKIFTGLPQDHQEEMIFEIYNIMTMELVIATPYLEHDSIYRDFTVHYPLPETEQEKRHAKRIIIDELLHYMKRKQRS